jgi:hypothetical protein
VKQTGGWTYGVLANHLWSFAGNEDRRSVNATYVQPFIAYSTKSNMTFSVNAESTYDWNESQWLVPVNLTVAQLVRIGSVPVQFQVGARYYAEGPSGAPEWGIAFHGYPDFRRRRVFFQCRAGKRYGQIIRLGVFRNRTLRPHDSHSPKVIRTLEKISGEGADKTRAQVAYTDATPGLHACEGRLHDCEGCLNGCARSPVQMRDLVCTREGVLCTDAQVIYTDCRRFYTDARVICTGAQAVHTDAQAVYTNARLVCTDVTFSTPMRASSATDATFSTPMRTLSARMRGLSCTDAQAVYTDLTVSDTGCVRFYAEARLVRMHPACCCIHARLIDTVRELSLQVRKPSVRRSLQT